MVVTQNNPYLDESEKSSAVDRKELTATASDLQSSDTPLACAHLKLSSNYNQICFDESPISFWQTDILIQNCRCNREQFCQWRSFKNQFGLIFAPSLLLYNIAVSASFILAKRQQNSVIIRFPGCPSVQGTESSLCLVNPICPCCYACYAATIILLF